VHIHHKVYLPTYGLFDEGRFFAWGDSIRAFDTRFGRAGMLIYLRKISGMLRRRTCSGWIGADLFFLFSSASPGRGFERQPAARIRSAGWSTSTGLMPGLFTAFVGAYQPHRFRGWFVKLLGRGHGL